MSRSTGPKTRRADRSRFRRRFRRASWLICVGVLLCAAVWQLTLVGFCVFHRVSYPYELSWMEGVLVDHARLLAAGKPTYDPPSAEFIPLFYTPASYHAASWLIRAGFDGFRAARLTSLFGIMGAGAIGMWLVCRTTRHRAMCLIVPALIAATYFDVDAYYDVARPDNLMVLFCTLAVAALTLSSTNLAAPLFAVCATLAIFAKQPSVLFFAVLLTGVFLIHRRLAVLSGLLSVAVAGGVFVWLDAGSDGWFHTYTVELPTYHRFTDGGLARSVADDLHGRFPAITYGMLLSLCAVCWTRPRTAGSPDPHRRSFLILLTAMVAAAAYTLLSRWNRGGATNVLVLYAVLGAAFVPAAVARGIDALGPPTRRALTWRAAALALSVLIAVKPGGLAPIAHYVPKASDRETWQRFRADLLGLASPDHIWVPYHGAVVGAAPSDPVRPHATAIWDYVGGTYGVPTGYRLPDDLHTLIQAQFFEVIVCPRGDAAIERLIGPTYRRALDTAPVDLPAFSGWDVGAESFWVPIGWRTHTPEAGAHVPQAYDD